MASAWPHVAAAAAARGRESATTSEQITPVPSLPYAVRYCSEPVAVWPCSVVAGLQVQRAGGFSPLRARMMSRCSERAGGRAAPAGIGSGHNRLLSLGNTLPRIER